MKKFMIAAAVISVFLINGCTEKETVPADAELKIFPDYRNVTIPVNIAPLNFRVFHNGDRYRCLVTDDKGTTIRVMSRDGDICFPLKRWQDICRQNAGGKIKFQVDVLRNGKWTAYPEFTQKISSSEIDPWLIYRLIHPQTGSWSKMGIYQRNLTNFKENTVIENSAMDNSCVNCHSVGRSGGDNFLLHIRAGKCGGTVIKHDGKLEKISPQIYDKYNGVAYHWWHPSGDYIVFSANSVNGRDINRRSVHLIDGGDSKSDLLIYDVKNHEFFTHESVFGSEYWESYPCWGPDGKTIYYCKAKAFSAQNFKDLEKIQYDLYSISFDIKTHEWGRPQLLVDAVGNGKSVAMPRVSPDGNYLIYGLYDYGIFPVFHEEADLWMLDLKTGRTRSCSGINTDQTESYHSWSSNGDWMVYSSKVIDKECGRPFIAHLNRKTGHFEKGFVLPQKNPVFYRDFEFSYNIPELSQTKISASSYDILKTASGKSIPAKVKEGPGTEDYKSHKMGGKKVWKPA